MDPEYFATLDFATLDNDGKRELYVKILCQDPKTAGAIAAGQHKVGWGELDLTPAEQNADKLFAAD